MTTPQRGFCATCNKFGARLACSACMSLEYCDAGCQRRSWKSHKLECKSRAASSLSTLQGEAKAGNTIAQYNLGVYYEMGFGVSADEVKAVTWYRRAAEAGNLNAQYNIGKCYLKGKGVSVDAAQAVTWYRRAAEAGHSKAQFNLGVCYHNGVGVPKDVVESRKWFRRAADAGHADASEMLSSMG